MHVLGRGTAPKGVDHGGCAESVRAQSGGSVEIECMFLTLGLLPRGVDQGGCAESVRAQSGVSVDTECMFLDVGLHCCFTLCYTSHAKCLFSFCKFCIRGVFVFFGLKANLKRGAHQHM